MSKSDDMVGERPNDRSHKGPNDATAHQSESNQIKLSDCLGMFVVSFVLLFTAALNNFTFSDTIPEILPRNGEYKVYGRLAKSFVDGPLSSSGFYGFCYQNREGIGQSALDSGLNNNPIQDVFYNQRSCPVFKPYRSHPALMGFFYYLIEVGSQSNISPRSIVAALFAFAVALISAWCACLFGITSAMLFVFLSLSFPWFILFGDNVAILMGAMYLPLALGLWAYALHQEERIGTIIFSALLFSLLINGPEFIFATLVSCFLPTLFYAKGTWRDRLMSCSKPLRGGFLALVVCVVVVVAQHIHYAGFSQTVEYVLYTIGKRTFGNPDEYNSYYAHFLNVSHWQVLNDYLRMEAARLGGISIRFYHVFFLLGGLTFLAWKWYRHTHQNVYQLVILSWLSALAPFAWLLLCKPHAAAHPFMDPLVWHVPFVLFVSMSLAVLLSSIMVTVLPKRVK